MPEIVVEGPDGLSSLKATTLRGPQPIPTTHYHFYRPGATMPGDSSNDGAAYLVGLIWVFFMLWVFGLLPKRVPRIPLDGITQVFQRWRPPQLPPQKVSSEEVSEDVLAPPFALRRQAHLAAELRAAKESLKGRGTGVDARRLKARIRVLEGLQSSALTPDSEESGDREASE
ncbi:hypothetical protein FB45DRAFT_908849 [Roridomyces roridus]|uniref:Uncharacterized protein n=1 Tax=Roridomyces roridus TaxID=1738132 RepID=A0AAD7FNL9_9AGAR|nr:hypothetical protein FB45DRAFT_908849 [Roridomyces roridus]